MNKAPLFLFFFMLVTTAGHAAQPVIVDSEGYACMGEDKSRKQTEQLAVQDCKRKATELASTYMASETRVKDAMLEGELVSAYANARVEVVKEIAKGWYRDAGLGDCFRVKMKVEVVPDEKKMAAVSAARQETLENDPLAPLNVRIWTDRPAYLEKDCMRIYLKGNKPFYGRVVYSQADGSEVQLLPNPYRQLNYFNGGTVYELPGGEDRYSLSAAAPYGREKITLYAGTAPFGDVEKGSPGNVYRSRSGYGAVAATARGRRAAAGVGGERRDAEFAEATVELKTDRR